MIINVLEPNVQDTACPACGSTWTLCTGTDIFCQRDGVGCGYIGTVPWMTEEEKLEIINKSHSRYAKNK